MGVIMDRGLKINLIIEIISMILVCFLSYETWNLFDTSEMASIASYYDDYYYIEDEIEKDGSVSYVSLLNNSNTKEDYYLVIDNTDILEVYINDVLYNVDDLNIKDNYIILDHSSLVNGNITYKINIVGNDNYQVKVLEELA